MIAPFYWEVRSMRRIFIVPIVFVVLLALATVVPVAASSSDSGPDKSGKVCGAKL